MAIAAPRPATLAGVMTRSDRLPNLSITALLIGAIALGVAAMNASAKRASGGALARDSVPWEALDMRGRQAPMPGSPYALLYVSAACPHCSATARMVDSISFGSGVPAYLVTDDAASVAARFADSLRLHHGLVLDTGGFLRRGASVRFVPTLWLYGRSAGVQLVRGERAPTVIGRLMGEIR